MLWIRGLGFGFWVLGFGFWVSDMAGRGTRDRAQAKTAQIGIVAMGPGIEPKQRQHWGMTAMEWSKTRDGAQAEPDQGSSPGAEGDQSSSPSVGRT